MLTWLSYLGLALSACIAATLLPMQSETALVALLTLKPSAVYSLVAVATFVEQHGIEQGIEQGWLRLSFKFKMLAINNY